MGFRIYGGEFRLLWISNHKYLMDPYGNLWYNWTRISSVQSTGLKIYCGRHTRLWFIAEIIIYVQKDEQLTTCGLVKVLDNSTVFKTSEDSKGFPLPLKTAHQGRQVEIIACNEMLICAVMANYDALTREPHLVPSPQMQSRNGTVFCREVLGHLQILTRSFCHSSRAAIQQFLRMCLHFFLSPYPYLIALARVLIAREYPLGGGRDIHNCITCLIVVKFNLN